MEKNFDKNYQLLLSDDVYKGNYSNLAIISHSSSEFVIDFARMSPGLKQPEICDRVILAPEHAKRLLMALNDNVMKYEHNFGPINLNHEKAQGNIAPFDINQGEA